MDETEGTDGLGIGQPHTVPYVGDYKTIAILGAMSIDGQQMFRTKDRVDASTFSSFRDVWQIRSDCSHTGQVKSTFIQGCNANRKE